MFLSLYNIILVYQAVQTGLAAFYQIGFAYASLYLLSILVGTHWESTLLKGPGQSVNITQHEKGCHFSKAEKHSSCVLALAVCGAQSFRNYSGSWRFL